MRRLAALLLLGSACGGTEDLTCGFLAEPDNCWARAAAAAAACLPGPQAMGVLSTDRTTCTFVDSSRVVFDAPLPSSTDALEQLAFTFVRADGSTCARFVDTFHNRMELSADGREVVSELHPGGTFHLHCDGTTYESSFDALFECPPTPVPTDGFSVAPDLVTFSISAITTPGELFRCMPLSP